MARPKKYSGKKEPFSIRLTKEEREQIEEIHGTVQNWMEFTLYKQVDEVAWLRDRLERDTHWNERELGLIKLGADLVAKAAKIK